MSVPLTIRPPLAPSFPEKVLLEDIFSALQSNPPSQKELAHAQRVVAERAVDATFREHILEEIANLAETVLKIEANFASITLSMQEIDNKAAVRDEKGVLIQLLPEWRSYHETYTTLLFTSQTTATQMKTKIDDLLVNLLPIINDPKISLSDKKAELQGYIEDLEEFQNKPSDKAREFLRLREGIMNFRTNLVNQVNHQRSHVADSVRVIKDGIDDLEKELASHSKLLSQCWSALKFDVPTVLGSVSAVSGAVMCLVTIAPVSGTFLLLAGFGAIGYSIYPDIEEKRQAMRDRGNVLENQYDTLKIREEDLEDIYRKLGLLNTTFRSVADQLETMHTIWTLLKSDAVELREAIHQTQNSKTHAGFRQRVQNVEKLWQTLALALDKYALGVTTIN